MSYPVRDNLAVQCSLVFAVSLPESAPEINRNMFQTIGWQDANASLCLEQICYEEQCGSLTSGKADTRILQALFCVLASIGRKNRKFIWKGGIRLFQSV